MKVLIDGDIVAYRCAATVLEDVDKDVAFARMDVLLQQIFDATEADTHEIWLTGSENFRKEIYPEYKANRKDTIPPVYLQECRAYLIEVWNAKVSHGKEADDMLGLGQTDDTVIATIDKDLRMVPGKHYNFVKLLLDEVTEGDAIRHFYKQLLIGDKSDNIIGVAGIGPVKAGKFIDPLDDEQEMLETVLALYDSEHRFIINAECLWIQQQGQESWTEHTQRVGLTLPSQLKHEAEVTLSFMKSLTEPTSTELGMNQIETCGIQHNGLGKETTPPALAN
jgi:DNA polymerase-1